MRLFCAAASARLCVETLRKKKNQTMNAAAASARLCVETSIQQRKGELLFAAASARLCVETFYDNQEHQRFEGSRLRAAVC